MNEIYFNLHNNMCTEKFVSFIWKMKKNEKKSSKKASKRNYIAIGIHSEMNEFKYSK